MRYRIFRESEIPAHRLSLLLLALIWAGFQRMHIYRHGQDSAQEIMKAHTNESPERHGKGMSCSVKHWLYVRILL